MGDREWGRAPRNGEPGPRPDHSDAPVPGKRTLVDVEGGTRASSIAGGPGKRTLVEQEGWGDRGGVGGHHEMFAEAVAEAHRQLAELQVALAAEDPRRVQQVARKLDEALAATRKHAASGSQATAGHRKGVALELHALSEPALSHARTPAGAGSDEPGRTDAQGELRDDGGAVQRRHGQASKLPFRGEMERAFGAEFGDVAVELGASAEMHAQGAHAVTRGNEISFASTTPNKELVAHELTHIVQQRRGGPVNQAKAIDAGTREALELEADAVGARVAAGGLAGPISGATAGTGLRDGDDNATDVFPPTTLLQVVGDRFQLTWKRVDKKLVCRVHYEGQAKASAPFLENNAVELEAELEDPKRKLNAKLARVTGTGVVVDMYGDALTIGTFKDVASPTGTGRSHAFSWEVGGLGFGAWVTMTVEDPGGGTAAAKKQGKAAEAKAISFVALDRFTLSAVRYGDARSAAVTLAGSGEVPNPQTFEVPLGASKLDHIAPKVVANDGHMIKVDLDADGKVDLTLVHTVREVSKSPDGKHQLREHHFRRFDKDGVLIGTYEAGMLYVVGGPTVAIPKEQDETRGAPDVGKEAPVTRPPAQGDELGELPRAVQAPGGVIEMRIDGDGDRTKELLLRFKGILPSDNYISPSTTTRSRQI